MKKVRRKKYKIRVTEKMYKTDKSKNRDKKRMEKKSKWCVHIERITGACFVYNIYDYLTPPTVWF